MTPQQLLEEVKGRFIILFHSDESALTALLRQSLGKFQEKAGIIFSVSAESATIPLPPDYWRTAMVHDAKWRYVPSRLNRETNEILLDTDSRNVSPYSLYYLISLRGWDMERDLPTSCISLVMDHLEALISIPNTERARMAASSTGLSSSEFPSIQDIRARVAEIEMQMEDSKAMLPPICVY